MKPLILAPLLLVLVGCSATYEKGFEIKKKSYNRKTGTEIRYLRSATEARNYCHSLVLKNSFCKHDEETRQYFISSPESQNVLWRIYY